MKLPTHIIEIKEMLILDKISWSDALKSLKEATAKKKPWHYKEWKQERDLLIKDSCIQCGHGNDQMVLQHLWHPRKIDVIFEQLAKTKLEANAVLKEQYIEELFKNSDQLNNLPIGERECCPKCESTSVKFIKTRKEWTCISTKSRCGRVVWRCGHSFKTPLMKQEYTPNEKKERSRVKSELKHKAHIKFNETPIREAYGKQAVLESIKDTERYLSLKDTTTFCKKCAYLMDVKQLLLCPNCNKYLPIWHVNSCTLLSI